MFWQVRRIMVAGVLGHRGVFVQPHVVKANSADIDIVQV